MRDQGYANVKGTESKVDYDLHTFGGLDVKLSDQIARLSSFADSLCQRADQLVGPQNEGATAPNSIRPIRSGIIGEFADKLERLDVVIDVLMNQETRISRCI